MPSLTVHAVDKSVFTWPFTRPTQPLLKPTPPRAILKFPGPGDIIAIDAEFVSVATQEDEVLPDGTRVIVKSSRQAPGRVTVISDSGTILMDDYVEVPEPIVDYLTRWVSQLHISSPECAGVCSERLVGCASVDCPGLVGCLVVTLTQPLPPNPSTNSRWGDCCAVIHKASTISLRSIGVSAPRRRCIVSCVRWLTAGAHGWDMAWPTTSESSIYTSPRHKWLIPLSCSVCRSSASFRCGSWPPTCSRLTFRLRVLRPGL
jgi:hypothetical protein